MNTAADNATGSWSHAPTVLELPDIFMISVFKRFTLKELLKCACVCKKWNQLIRDGSLWRHIDLTHYKSSLTLGDVERLISVYATDSTRQVTLVGNYVEDASSSSTSSAASSSSTVFSSLDAHFFTHVLAAKSARSLTHLTLSHVDLAACQLDLLAELGQLDTVSLSWCNLSPRWFKSSRPRPHDQNTSSEETANDHPTDHNDDDDDDDDEANITRMDNLRHFYLIRCCGVSLHCDDIKRICATAPGLRTLCINQSQSSLSDDSVEAIVSRMQHLESLSLNNTLITDAAVYAICTSPSMCARLRTLNLARSTSLSNRCLEWIGTSLVGLRSLHLTSCFGISNALAIAKFVGQLSYLNLNNTSIDKDKIREHLVPLMLAAHSEIEYGHEKMLNRKLMWTINGSRNCVCSF